MILIGFIYQSQTWNMIQYEHVLNRSHWFETFDHHHHGYTFHYMEYDFPLPKPETNDDRDLSVNILTLHDMGTGCDLPIALLEQVLTSDKKTSRGNIHVISICRPGYLESKWNESFANSTIILEQTSTMVHELILSKSLNHLHLLAIGAGAPFALDYVTRYKNEKNHLNSLILFNAITRQYEKRASLHESSILSTLEEYVYTLLSIGAGKSFALNFMGYVLSKLSMKYPLYSTNLLLSSGVNDTQELNECVQYAINNQLDLINHTVWNGLWLKRSKRKEDNDLKLLKQLPNDSNELLQQITIPTLIMHSTVNKWVDFDYHSKYASQQIPNAKLLEFKGCGHWSSLGIGQNSNEWKNSLKDWLLKFVHAE